MRSNWCSDSSDPQRRRRAAHRQRVEQAHLDRAGARRARQAARPGRPACRSSTSRRTRTPRSAARCSSCSSCRPLRVAVDQVVLQVERNARAADQRQPRGQRVAAVGQQPEARQRGSLRGGVDAATSCASGASLRLRSARAVRLAASGSAGSAHRPQHSQQAAPSAIERASAGFAHPSVRRPAAPGAQRRGHRRRRSAVGELDMARSWRGAGELPKHRCAGYSRHVAAACAALPSGSRRRLCIRPCIRRRIGRAMPAHDPARRPRLAP